MDGSVSGNWIKGGSRMSQTKYITSGGLAFSEDKDLEKLRRYSQRGWHVRNFKFMGYTLEKGESSDYIYSVDYRSLKEDDKEEYLNYFSSSGWSHVASEGNIHLFRAVSGTKPIYTDRDTFVEKYSNLNNSMKKVAVPLLLIAALGWILVWLSSGTLETSLLIAASILSVFALPAAWTILASYSNKWKAKEKQGVANLLKTIPFLFLLAFIILLFVNVPDRAVRILTSGVIGGIGFPTVIWMIMSLYHKIGGKASL